MTERDGPDTRVVGIDGSNSVQHARTTQHTESAI